MGEVLHEGADRAANWHPQGVPGVAEPGVLVDGEVDQGQTAVELSPQFMSDQCTARWSVLKSVGDPLQAMGCLKLCACHVPAAQHCARVTCQLHASLP